MPSSISSIICKYSKLHHLKIFRVAFYQGSRSVPCSVLSEKLPPSADQNRYRDPQPGMQRVGELGTLIPIQDVSKEFLPQNAQGTPWKRRQEDCKKPEGEGRQTLPLKSANSLYIRSYRETGSMHRACTGLHQMGDKGPHP